jgi:thiol:disulfide interchange protein
MVVALKSALALMLFLAFGPSLMTSPAMALPAATADLPKPLPEPYSAEADAKADIKAALARAKTRNTRVLIEFGGNWCPDCRVLAGVLSLAEVKAQMDKKFEILAVDVGRRDRNLDVAEAYGLSLKGVPTVLVLGNDGKIVPDGVILSLSDARGMTPQSIVDTLMMRAAP